MKQLKLFMLSLLFIVLSSCTTYQSCPAYSELDKQNINQNQTEMKVIEQFIEPSYIPQEGDILVFKNGNKGELVDMSTYSNILPGIYTLTITPLYYHIKTKHNYRCATSAPYISHIERDIIGTCSLPPTQDLLKQLQPSDKVLLKQLKDNPWGSDYETHKFACENLIKYLGTEITIKQNPYNNTSSTNNIVYAVGLLDTNDNWWFPKEIEKITFIRKNGKTTIKTG